MPIKVGNSYVTEAAYNYAKSRAEEEKSDSGVMKSLSEKFPSLKFGTGTKPFAGAGTNNVSISPKILKQMENDPEKRMEYEALIYDIANTDLVQGRKLKSAGWIIGDDGGLRAWSVSGQDTRKQSFVKRSEEKNWWQKMLAPDKKKKSVKSSKERQKEKAATVELSAQAQTALTAKQIKKSANFADTNALAKYLQNNYDVYKKGMTKISSKYLNDCLTDETKRQKLFDNLQAADAALKEKEGQVGFQGMRVTIDENGEVTMESSSGNVTINEEKSRRQIAAAATKGDMKQVLALLAQDLREVEDGLKQNMCDEAEVEKAKALIEEAKQQMAKLPDRAPTPAEQTMMNVNMLI